MLPSAKGISFTLCWVSLPTPFYLRSKYLCQLCVHWFSHVYLLHLLYCFMLTTIHEIYMLQVESNCWNFIILCLLQCLLLWIYCFMSYLLCKTFWCLSWKYYSWKVFAYMIHCLLFIYLLANYRPLLWVTSFMTWALQYIDQDCVKACLLRNYLLLSFYLLEDE